MPRPRAFDLEAISVFLQGRGGVATHEELMRFGMSRSTIIRWAKDGPWQTILPGVILGHRGTPTVREMRLAALAFCGANAVISGTHALDLHGILSNRIDAGPEIFVLIPHGEQRKSKGFVVVERTVRLPVARVRAGFPIAPVARAAADAARSSTPDIDRVREIFGATIQQGRCSIEELRSEVFAGQRRQTHTSRTVLREVTAGTMSAAEGRAFGLIASSDLPQPLWNEDVIVDGEWIGQADGYWPELRVVLEIDGLRWHSSPHDIRRTQEKQRRYAAAGITVITYAPADIWADPGGFIEALRRTLARAAQKEAG